MKLKPHDEITLMLTGLAIAMSVLMLFQCWNYTHMLKLETAQVATVKACEASIAGQAP